MGSAAVDAVDAVEFPFSFCLYSGLLLGSFSCICFAYFLYVETQIKIEKETVSK